LFVLWYLFMVTLGPDSMICEHPAENSSSARRRLLIPLLLLFGCDELFCSFIVGLGWNCMTFFLEFADASGLVSLPVSAFTTVHGEASGWLHDYQGLSRARQGSSRAGACPAVPRPGERQVFGYQAVMFCP
jgi:hypothetical protein